MSDKVGQQPGNYRLMRLLGEGGFAQVYPGEHIYLSIQAAIKALNTQLTSDSVKWFRTEARIITLFVYPNIVRVLDFGVGGSLFRCSPSSSTSSMRQRLYSMRTMKS